MSNPTHREEINLYEAIQKSFLKILIKDLTEHERICPVCNGIGMKLTTTYMESKAILLRLGEKCFSHINIRPCHFVSHVLTAYKDCVRIVANHM